MYKIEDIATNLKISVRSARSYYSALKPILRDHVFHGKKNALLFDSYAFQLLEQLAMLRESGMSISQAAESIQEELEPQAQQPPVQQEDLIKAKDDLIDQLRTDNQRLYAQIDYLESLITQLKPRALPSTTRNPLRWLFHRKKD
jgi:DNA-binding transcriptional MerR regulator